MGKWDHRPRRFFRRKRSPVPPPKFYDLNAPLPEFWQDGVPLWEKEYCTLIGSVPWQKIVDAKQFEFCHNNVLDWNDSAAEEAFQNAKKQYWAKINSLPCDVSPPDPDMYVDQIDWNPYIDPEVVKELDSAYFPVPGEEEESSIKNKRTKLSGNGENHGEHTGTPPGRSLENKVEGLNQWDYNVNDSGNVGNTDNPWDCIINHQNGGWTDNAWESGHVKLWDWKEGRDHKNHSRDWDSGHSPWENNSQAHISQKDKEWGKVKDSSWSSQKSNNLVNVGNPWETKFDHQNVTQVSTGWRNRAANVSGWKQQEDADFPSKLQFRRNYGDQIVWNQSFQRREGSNQHTFGHNGSQFRRDDRQTGNYWRRENSKRRNFTS